MKFLMIFVLSFLQVRPNDASRRIYIFADKATNADAIQQVNMLNADVKGLKDRRITYQVITWSAANQQQYKKWGITNVPFTVILIGLDQGEKLRSHQPVPLSKLFDLIDNMPMRREEIKHKL